MVLGGGGAGAYFIFGGGHKERKPRPRAVKPAVFLDVPEVLVNLSNAAPSARNISRSRSCSNCPMPRCTAQIQTAMPRVMDAFQTYLRELRPTDLDGSAGLYRLKEELTRRVNVAIAPSRINAVLFKEIVVQ